MAELALQEAVSHLTVRAAEPGDLAFVFSSWLKSYRRSKEREIARVDKHAYFDARAFCESQDIAQRRLLRRSRVVIVCGNISPADIYAFAVVEHRPRGSILHWVYSKQVFRRMGLARHLLDSIGSGPWQHSHETAAFAPLATHLLSQFNPSLSR